MIKLLDHADLFELKTKIQRVHLGFYFNGKRVWEIDVKSTNCENLLQVIDISCNIVKTIKFRMLIEDPVKSYFVGVDNKTQTLYETLLLLSMSYSVKQNFKRNLRITNEKGEELTLDSLLEYVPNESVFDINFADIKTSSAITITFEKHLETGFLFDLNTKTKDFKKVLSLFLETHEEKLEFNTTCFSIDKKTLKENYFEAENQSVIINYLKRGGSKSFNTMRVDPSDVSVIGPSSTAPI